jgi:hypothetical protein
MGNWTHFPYPGDSCRTIAVYFQALNAANAGLCVLSGMAVSRASASSVSISSGTYVPGSPETRSYAGGTLAGIPAASSGKHRYDLVYMDTADNTIKRLGGTEDTPSNASLFLENAAPQPPALPSETCILLAIICADQNGIRSSNNGSYSVSGVADMRMKAPFGAHLISYLSIAGEARGDLIMRGASQWNRFAPGSSDKYLRSGGAASDLVWDYLLIGSLYHASQARGNLIMRGATTWGLLPPDAEGKFLACHEAGADLTWETPATPPGGSNFWNDVPGNPQRSSNAVFTITDTGNANNYDKLFKKGVLIKWDYGGSFKTAMVISSSYASNTVTVNTVGDALSAGFSSMKFCMAMALEQVFIIPGTLPSAATSNISKTWRNSDDVYILSADLWLETPGSGSGSTVVDINDDGTTKFTTKPTITSTGQSDIDNVADNPSTAVTKGSAITIDVDSVTSTPPADGYVTIFHYPASWRYRT